VPGRGPFNIMVQKVTTYRASSQVYLLKLSNYTQVLQQIVFFYDHLLDILTVGSIITRESDYSCLEA